MISRANEGILYPGNPEIKINTTNTTELPAVFTVPHMSWNYIEKDLSELFEKIGTCKPDNIFVFGLLHQGKIGFDDEFTIYTDSDCPVQNPILTKSDDVCSEEIGAEILLPYLDKYFNGIPVNQFLTPGKSAENAVFFKELLSQYKNSLIFISRNFSEDPVWPESLQD